MIDHFGMLVKDIQQSKEFYIAVLEPLGYGLIAEYGEHIGFGKNGKPDFWISPGETNTAHIAFAAENRAQVDAFYKVALEKGAKDNGAPGVREMYHPTYYGAFVIDPNGYNIEAVCHKPE